MKHLALAAALLLPPAPALAQAGFDGVDLAKTVTYYVGEGEPRAGFREGDRQLAEWAVAAWANRAEPRAQTAAAPEATAAVRIYWVQASDGLFGEMRVRRLGDGFSVDVYVNADTDGLGANLAGRARSDPLFRDTLVFLTCVHELGHAFGLEHTDAFADIMYSFQYGGDFLAYFMRFRDQLKTRADIPKASPFSAGDLAALRAVRR